MNIYIGIDFGAENILVSYKKDDEKTWSGDIIKDQNSNEGIIKNWVAMDLKKGKEYFGLAAYTKFLENEDFHYYNRYKDKLIINPDLKIDNDVTPRYLLKKGFIYILKNIGASGFCVAKHNLPMIPA